MANYSHLNKEQRDVIQHLISLNKNFTEIGDAIGKDRTAVSREIRRNRYLKVIIMKLMISKVLMKL